MEVGPGGVDNIVVHRVFAPRRHVTLASPSTRDLPGEDGTLADRTDKAMGTDSSNGLAGVGLGVDSTNGPLVAEHITLAGEPVSGAGIGAGVLEDRTIEWLFTACL